MDGGPNKIAPLQRQNSLTVDQCTSPLLNLSTGLSGSNSGNQASPIASSGSPDTVTPKINIKFGKPEDVDIEMLEESSSSDDEAPADDQELLLFQKQKTIPLVRLSSVNQENENEEVILEIDDFSKIDDNVGQMGLLAAGKEKEFAKAVLKTH